MYLKISKFRPENGCKIGGGGVHVDGGVGAHVAGYAGGNVEIGSTAYAAEGESDAKGGGNFGAFEPARGDGALSDGDAFAS